MLRKFRIGLFALKELGIRQVGLYALYRLGLFTGHYRRKTPAGYQEKISLPLAFHPVFTVPDREKLIKLLGDQKVTLIQEADHITQGRVRLFGAEPVNLSLSPAQTDPHWTETRIGSREDIKLTWEPARFGWAFTLGRAYLISGDDKYAEAFWQHWETFTAVNPVNCGPNWESGQEVALRLIAYLFAMQVFADSPQTSEERKNQILQAIVDHANRIPPTLIYARAQDNNHLVSEACGLFLAGAALLDHPRAEDWRKRGWHWLEFALSTQFDPDGTYIQHSMNYHRMVLHLALLGQAGARRLRMNFSPEVMAKLSAGTRWLIAQIERSSGDVPNLGNNDGANILPLASGSFRDHRPTAQSAAVAFLGNSVLPAGFWDELAAWLGLVPDRQPLEEVSVESPAVRRLGNAGEWATLRAVHYRSRPAHADQLHIELWFNGVNVLRDPGTYSYSQNPPWNNSLVHSRYHNTLTIDGQDPMLRAGKFLWLQRDQAEWVEDGCVPGRILMASHDGYHRMGFQHRRSLEWVQPGIWEVIDWVTPARKIKTHKVAVHWLLLDGQWSLEDQKLTVVGENEKVTIAVTPDSPGQNPPVDHQLVSGGVLLHGTKDGAANEGWYSPTYGQLEPALSYQVTFTIDKPVIIRTRIHLERIE